MFCQSSFHLVFANLIDWFSLQADFSLTELKPRLAGAELRYNSSCSQECFLWVCFYWFLSTSNEQSTVQMMKYKRINTVLQYCRVPC